MEKNPSSEDLQAAIVTMAVESWRLNQIFDRLLLQLDAGEQSRYNSRLRWFTKKVDEALGLAGLKIIDVTGFPFDHGIAATALNIEEFGQDDVLIIESMLEPIVMGEQGLVKTGTVILRREQ